MKIAKICLLTFSALPTLVMSSRADAAPKKGVDGTDRVLDATTDEKKRSVKGASNGLSAILGGEYGILKATPDDSTKFAPKNGNTLELKLLAGWLFKDFMIDSGAGFYYYKVRGKEFINEKNEKVDNDRELSVSGLLVEFSPLYRLTNNIFTGVVTQIRVPAFNDYYSEAAGTSLQMTAGGQLGFQFFDRELNSRVTLKAHTSLGLKGWKDVAYAMGIQFGLPFRQPDSLIIRKTTTVNKLREVVEYRKKDFTITLTANVVKLALDNVLTFYVDPSGRPTLTPEAQVFLLNIGNSLTANDYLWESLRVDAQSPGHITSVTDSLGSIGVPSRKIKRGKSLQEVADGGNASVDFTFSGVKNTQQLADKIREAMKTAKIPENCNKNGVCE
ncbi:MAG: hypothetical protein ACO3A4_06595 [Silvanigrellaceae bacterium]